MRRPLPVWADVHGRRVRVIRLGAQGECLTMRLP
jgi:hypothetical protein